MERVAGNLIEKVVTNWRGFLFTFFSFILFTLYNAKGEERFLAGFRSLEQHCRFETYYFFFKNLFFFNRNVVKERSTGYNFRIFSFS